MEVKLRLLASLSSEDLYNSKDLVSSPDAEAKMDP